MKQRLSLTLFGLLLLATSAPAQQKAAADTTDFPSPVRHRSRCEELLALPGTVVYLPFHLVFYAGRQTAGAIWEKRVLDHVRAWLTTADGRAGIRPLASTQVGTGARIFYKDLIFSADASLISSRGQEKRQHHLFLLSWPRGLLLPGAFRLVAQFRQEPKESFFGIGHETSRSDRTSFLQEEVDVRLLYQQRLNRAFSLDADLGYHAVDIGTGIGESASALQGRYAPGQLPGMDDRVHHLESALLLRALFVDLPGSPTRGNRSLMRLGYRRSVDDDAFSHFQLLVRTEQFFELFYRRTLALHLGSDWRFAPGDDQVPFYDLASLGGSESLRGYRRGRFRDRGVVFATATYKYPVWKLVDGELFYETGRTFHRPGDFTFAGWKPSFGAGLRVWVPDGLIFEQIIARSPEEVRLLFNFKADF